jgi:GNAT superfamily N-acetyltransferase
LSLPPSILVVRQVRASDLDEIRALRLASLRLAPEAFFASYAHESEQPRSFWEARVTSNAAGTNTVSYLAFLDGRGAGSVVGARGSSADAAHLYAMWVEPFARRRGVGEALVDAVVGWARRAGCGRLLLEVLEGNDGAERLYRRCGFTFVSARPLEGRSPPVQERTFVRLLD